MSTKMMSIGLACAAALAAAPVLAQTSIFPFSQSRTLMSEARGEGSGVFSPPDPSPGDTNASSIATMRGFGPFPEMVMASTTGGLSRSNAMASLATSITIAPTETIGITGILEGQGSFSGSSASWRHAAESSISFSFFTEEPGFFAFSGEVMTSFSNLGDLLVGNATAASTIELRDENQDVILSLLASSSDMLNGSDNFSDMVQDNLDTNIFLDPGMYTLHASATFDQRIAGGAREINTSFSASFTAIPTPGAASIFTLACLATARRRRATT